ncbi:hypothetical protein HYQ46_009856 [Verticillium longisporum]|nr:hypothetical protein HYQ46_009856 [Verticillium longisporum]
MEVRKSSAKLGSMLASCSLWCRPRRPIVMAAFSVTACETAGLETMSTRRWRSSGTRPAGIVDNAEAAVDLLVKDAVKVKLLQENGHNTLGRWRSEGRGL